jgi:ligand-binding sensor domain-containing protein
MSPDRWQRLLQLTLPLAGILCIWTVQARGEWQTFTVADGLVGNRIQATLEDQKGNLWIATSEGVARYDGANWTRFTVDDGLVGSDVTTIVEDRAGNLWFGTDGYGISRFDGTTWKAFDEGDGLPALFVVSGLVDCTPRG